MTVYHVTEIKKANIPTFEKFLDDNLEIFLFLLFIYKMCTDIFTLTSQS